MAAPINNFDIPQGINSLDQMNQGPKIQNEEKKGTCKGRVIKQIRDFFVELGHGLVVGAKKIASYVGRIFTDCTCLGRVCRLGVNAIAIIEKCIGRPGIFTSVNNQLNTTESIVSTVGVGDQIKYFGTGKQKKESILTSLGQGALLAAGIVGVCVLIGQLVLAGLSRVCQACGATSILNMVVDVGCKVASGFAAGGFLALAVDNAKKIAEAKTTREKVQGVIDLVWSISETAFSAFAASGFSNFIAGIVLGSIAAGLGFVSFIYGAYVEDEEKLEKKQSKLSSEQALVLQLS